MSYELQFLIREIGFVGRAWIGKLLFILELAKYLQFILYKVQDNMYM